MNHLRRRIELSVLLAGLLAVFALSYWRLTRIRESAILAGRNWQRSATLTEQLELLKAAPLHASLEDRGRQDLTSAIQRAAQVAGIDNKALVRITPQSGRRAGTSGYLERSLTVELRVIALDQLVRMVRELSSAECGLIPTSMRINAPRAENVMSPEKETWSVEMVLTHLVFSPEYATARPSATSSHAVGP